MKLSSLSFVIPTCNDEQTMTIVLEETSDIGKKVAEEFVIIVLNDGSTDTTSKILEQYRESHKELLMLSHKKNKGYGETIRELYYKARTDWIFSLPGDYQVGAKELLKLLPSAEKYDLILGKREKRNDNPFRRIQSQTYNMLLRLLFGMNITDVNSVRLMKRAVISGTILTSKSAFVDAELTIRALRRGFRVKEVPIIHRPRTTSGATGGKVFRTILPTIGDMIRFRLTVSGISRKRVP